MESRVESMELRLAQPDDLPGLKIMYQGIVGTNSLCQWDEYYPCCFLAEDIEQKRLYVLTQQDDIVSAFTLSRENEMENHAAWSKPAAKPMYLGRFGVNAAYARQGFGGVMLQKAVASAKAQGADALRLFVVDGNEPAIRLYRKNGFHQLAEMVEQVVDDGFVLHEFAFEMEL